MKKIILISIMLLSCLYVSAFDKTLYDVEKELNDNLFLSKTNNMIKGKSISKNITEATLLPNAYFTIGTSGGSVNETLDNDCQITYGHPYAKTSYPYFSIDGSYYHPETYFYSYSQDITSKGDSLIFECSDSLKISMRFEIIQINEGDSILLNLKLKNLDSLEHDLGLGLVFDPALGKWGDGTAFISDREIKNDTIVQASIPNMIEIWERKTGFKGMGINMMFSENTPDNIHIGNWRDIYEEQGALISQIYDLALDMVWDPMSLEANECISYSLVIMLQEPEFPEDLFIRADLPVFLSIENNSLFPRTIEPMVELFNNDDADHQNIHLHFSGGEIVEDWSSSDAFDLEAGSKLFKKSLLKFPEIYEDRLVSVSLEAVQDSITQDQLFRNIYIPATPFSDTGLVVEIDTLISSDFPEVELVFSSTVEETGQLLTDLGKENIFLYEDQLRIHDFDLEKDTTGGTNQADIVFVLDVTGSMSNEIGAVKDNMIEFTDSLSYRGIDYRLGMVTFLDVIENVYDFTSDVQQFQQHVGDQYAHGGGDYAENSLEALMRATRFDFRPSANRVLIWITDASYHINNSNTQLTQQEVVNAMLANGIQTHCIGNPSEQTSYYDPIVNPTGGYYFSINGNFRDILLEISRMKTSGKYRITYYSDAVNNAQHETKLELHYAGLGGYETIAYTPGSGSGAALSTPSLSCYPNPFNPAIRINIFNPNKLRGEVSIFNLLGQNVKEMSFSYGHEQVELLWDASDHSFKGIGTGVYLVRTSLYDQNGKASVLPIQKIIYIK